jgi:hypothetical protein
MSEWERGCEVAKKEKKAMERLVKSYGYRDEKSAGRTDIEVRKAVAGHVNDSRDLVFPMIEAAYLAQDMDDAGALEDVMQWLDVFLLELGLKLEWNDHAMHRNYVTLIRSDLALMQNSEKLHSAIGKLNEGYLKKKSVRSVKKRCEDIRSFISDVMLVFKKRRHSLGG